MELNRFNTVGNTTGKKDSKKHMVMVLITILFSENSSPFCQFVDGCYCMDSSSRRWARTWDGKQGNELLCGEYEPSGLSSNVFDMLKSKIVMKEIHFSIVLSSLQAGLSGCLPYHETVSPVCVLIFITFVLTQIWQICNKCGEWRRCGNASYYLLSDHWQTCLV